MLMPNTKSRSRFWVSVATNVACVTVLAVAAVVASQILIDNPQVAGQKLSETEKLLIVSHRNDAQNFSSTSYGKVDGVAMTEREFSLVRSVRGVDRQIQRTTDQQLAKMSFDQRDAKDGKNFTRFAPVEP